MSVRLYADERNFQAKPIAMNWDERGRLWICETVDYPNALGGNRDRIRICEVTDGDHVADKFTVFAEQLSIPTAIVIVQGGAVVQNAEETIFLKDNNGDDVADERTTLITGWNAVDTHGGVSNFRYGLDNWIWAMQGYNNSSPKVDGEGTQNFRQGFWRFKLSHSSPPKVTDLEFVRSSDNNTWGLGISEEGLIFGSTANHNPSMFVPIPNRYYERVRGWAPSTLRSIADTHLFDPVTEKVRQVDHHGGYTAGAGHALYTTRAFPSQWWNKTAFVCGPTGHLVGTFVLRPDGANYTSSSPVNLLASDDEWSAPVMAEVGPDGAVWVIDWYNYIVQHNPTPNGFATGKGRAYESDLRDKKHGRIYRVLATQDGKEQLHPFTSLADASNLALVEQLKHPSFTWRLQAQRLLVERGAKNVVRLLLALLRDEETDALGLHVGAIHALHTLDGMGLISKDATGADDVHAAIVTALEHPSAGVRRNAILALPLSELGNTSLLSNKQLFADNDAQVRLQAILTLADIPPSSAAGPLLAQLASSERDLVLVDALTCAAATHAVDFLESIASDDAQPSSSIERITARVAEHVARSRPNANSLRQIVSSVARAHPAVASQIVDGLTQGLPADYTVSSEALDSAFATTFEASSNSLKGKLLRLAGRCGSSALESYSAEIIESLVAVIQDDTADAADRAAAAGDLVGFRSSDGEVIETILSQLNAQTPPDVAEQFLAAVQQSQAESAGEHILRTINTMTPALQSPDH